jgi:hypothetical protein
MGVWWRPVAAGKRGGRRKHTSSDLERIALEEESIVVYVDLEYRIYHLIANICLCTSYTFPMTLSDFSTVDVTFTFDYLPPSPFIICHLHLHL